jgi:hypothetical protein
MNINKLNILLQKMQEIVKLRFVPSTQNNAVNWDRFLRRVKIVPTEDQLKNIEKIIECAEFDKFSNSEIYMMYIQLQSFATFRG